MIHNKVFDTRTHSASWNTPQTVLCTVEQRRKKFAEGHTSIDAAWSGKPSETISETVCCVHTKVK